MTSAVGGIDPRQGAFTLGIVDTSGVELTHETCDDTAAGCGAAIDLLDAHGVELVGVEGSAKWGAHVAIALAAARFDAREVPASRSAALRRSRRLEGTDAVDAVASARALLAEPALGPVQALEVYDPIVAETEAVLGHRRALAAARTLGLHHAAGQISELPTEIRDQLATVGKIEARLRRLEHLDPAECSTPAGRHRLTQLQAFVEQDREARREIRRPERLIDELLDCHRTALRDEHGIGPISAATLLCEAGDPARLDRETRARPLARHRRRRLVLRRPQRPARQAPARLRRQPTRQLGAAHRVGHPGPQPARRRRPAPPEKPAKTRPAAKPDEPTNATSPTASPDACGETNNTA